MKIRNPKTGEIIQVPPHLTEMVKKAIESGQDPREIISAKNGRKIKKAQEGIVLEGLGSDGLDFDMFSGFVPEGIGTNMRGMDNIDQMKLMGTDLITNPFDQNPQSLQTDASIPLKKGKSKKPLNFISNNPRANRMLKGINTIAQADGDPLKIGLGAAKTAFGAGALFSGIAGDIISTQEQKDYEFNQQFSQLDGALSPNFQNIYSDEQMGISKLGSNPAMAKFGKQITDIDQLKVDRNEGNVEIEKTNGIGEFVYYPNKKFGGNLSSGKPHSMGGTVIDTEKIQGDAYILSSHLKDPETGLPYAEIAKPWATEKQIKFVKDNKSVLTPLDLKTNDLVKNMKSKKIEDVWNKQEHDVYSGVHGIKAIKTRLENNQDEEGMAKYGGTLKKVQKESMQAKYGKKMYAQSGAKVDEKGLDFFGGNLDLVYALAKTRGFSGKKDIGELQKWIVKNNPKLVDNYFQMVRPNNKALSMAKDIAKERWEESKDDAEVLNSWKEDAKKYGMNLNSEQDYMDYLTKEIANNAFTPEQRLEAFQDDLWDFRFPDFTGEGRKPVSQQFSNTSLTDSPYTNVPDLTNLFSPEAQSDNNQLGYLPIPNTYSRLPIHLRQTNPQFVNPRRMNVEGSLAEMQRMMTPQGNTSVDASNIAQLQANKFNAINQLMQQKQNFDIQSATQADMANAQMLMNTDLQNINQYNAFRDLYLRGEGVLDTQKRVDQQGMIKNQMLANQYDSTNKFLKQNLNPSDGSYTPMLDLFTQAEESKTKAKSKYGKKIKIKKK